MTTKYFQKLSPIPNPIKQDHPTILMRDKIKEEHYVHYTIDITITNTSSGHPLTAPFTFYRSNI
ncbi:hypothetical protein ADUPG1_005840, partial [Aduncisulcus paluster]